MKKKGNRKRGKMDDDVNEEEGEKQKKGLCLRK